MSDKQTLDDFWNIERITPVKKTVSRPASDTEPVSVHFGKDGKRKEGERIPDKTVRQMQGKSVLEEMQSGVEKPLEYKPDNPDILRVRVSKWPTSYSFYDKFLSEGKKYLHTSCPESEYIPFFSYMPQYHQLNLYQIRYYLWWRENVRHGTFLQTDGGYIFLYLYELINIDDSEFTLEYRAEKMAEVWLGYRESYPKLDACIGEWLCDFCLIHQLTPPESLQKISGKIAAAVSLREFYTNSKQGFTEEHLCDFIRANNSYDYKRSSVYIKNKELFDTHLIRSVAHAVKASSYIGDDPTKVRLSRMSRDSYSGALCASKNKRRIDIEYYSHFSGSRFKPMIGSLMKYSENKLRDRLNVKSRLSASNIPEELRCHVDEYYSSVLPYTPKQSQQSVKISKEERIRYDLYEPIDEKLDIDGAFEIEDKSWDTTLKLVPEDEIEYIIPTPAATEDDSEECGDDYERFLCSLDTVQYEFIKLIYDGKVSEAKDLCERNSLIPFAVQDDINAICSDATGDIIIQDMEIIGDYRDELKFK